jgi:hypothetical protein
MRKISTLMANELILRNRIGRGGKHLYFASVAGLVLSLHTGPGFAGCGGPLDIACNTGKTLEKAAHDTGHTVEKAAHDTGHTVEKAAHDTGHTVEKAAHDTGKSIEKAVQDTGKAGESVFRFGVREIKGIGTSAKDARKRLKEGKFVDALWHFATDPLKHAEENAGKAAQESNLVRIAGQIAASAYGGPGGAAAYAAWLTYNQTKDVGLSLRVGAITGAAAYGTAAVGQIPNAKASVIAEKTIMAGAIGGVAVAAAGGDKQAIQEGFLKAGGAVLVQSVYERETHHELDARASKGPAWRPSIRTPRAHRRRRRIKKSGLTERLSLGKMAYRRSTFARRTRGYPMWARGQNQVRRRSSGRVRPASS